MSPEDLEPSDRHLLRPQLSHLLQRTRGEMELWLHQISVAKTFHHKERRRRAQEQHREAQEQQRQAQTAARALQAQRTLMGNWLQPH